MTQQDQAKVTRPGFKLTKLGWLPEEWEYEKIEQFATRRSGHTPDKKKPEYYEGDIKWVSLKDSSRLDDLLITETETTISEAGIANSSAVLLPAGTVVLSRDAGVGKSAILGEDMAVSQHFIAWTCGNYLSNEYLYYFLQSQKRFFERMAVGSTIKTIGLPLFKKYKIVIPPLKEQTRIATCLSTWGRAITTTRHLLEQLETRKKGLMQRLLTGEVRLPGFSSAAASGGEGEWRFEKLGNILGYEQPTKYLVKNKEYSDEFETPVLTAGKTFLLGYTKETDGIYKERLPVILFDDFTTASKYVDFPFKVKSSAAKFLNLKDDQHHLSFIFGAMQVINFVPDSHKRYWISEFSELDIRVPSLKEQTAIATVLTAADREITLYEAKLKTLETQKRGLMQQLLTGQKRLSA